MTTSGDRREARSSTSDDSPFGRVLVGIDGTEPGFEACRQAVRLAAPQSAIAVVAVVHISEEARALYGAADVADRLQADAERALETARGLIGDRARPRFVDGFVTEALLREIEAEGATLVALGTHGHRRTTELLIGGVAGELLHRAPCSVLVTRPSADADRFPRSIVVGVDGSAGSEYALRAAEHLAARLHARVRVIVATHGDSARLDRAHRLAPAAEAIAARPVDALVTASRGADLLVVGSRGVRGLHALGSVSERAAHHASCSVLVARPASSQVPG
jgi:nucleotide-binding universal stress UspA family protein